MDIEELMTFLRDNRLFDPEAIMDKTKGEITHVIRDVEKNGKIDFSDPNSFPGSQDLHPKWCLFWSNFRQNKTQQIARAT